MSTDQATPSDKPGGPDKPKPPPGKVAFGCLSLVGLAFLVLVIIGAIASAFGGSKKSTTTTTKVSAAKATTTTAPDPVSGAVIGGTAAAWQAKFGAPTPLSDPHGSTPDDLFEACPGPSPPAPASQLQIWFDSGSGRVWHIEGGSCTNPNEPNGPELQEAKTYLPPDATQVGQVCHSTPGEDDYVFSSKVLAAALPASDFKNFKNPAPAGTVAMTITPGDWDISSISTLSCD